MESRQRWPGWVYTDGEEPDYRFSFANERTFLAWVRTALALIASGVVVDALSLSIPTSAQRSVAALLVVLGAWCAGAAWLRWASSERAIRSRRPLPATRLGLILVVLVVAAAAILVAYL